MHIIHRKTLAITLAIVTLETQGDISTIAAQLTVQLQCSIKIFVISITQTTIILSIHH